MGSLFRKSEDTYCQQGMNFLAKRQYDYAKAEFEKGLRKYPKSFSLYANRANLWILTGDFVQAAGDLSKALDHLEPGSPNEWAIRLNRGTCYVRLEQYARANRDFEKALSSAPRDADAVILAKGYFYRALANIDCDDDSALKDARKAVELDPQQPQYRKLAQDLAIGQLSPEALELGQEIASNLQSGNWEGALAAADRMLKLEPGSAKGWQMKGAALHQLGRYDEELDALSRSIKIDGNEVALFNRAACYIALGKVEEAKNDLHEFLQRGTHEPTLRQAQVILAQLG
jgi:tetratricopeptide (TPR) repeat protein